MSTPASTETGKLTRKDFVSGQEVRWCPGCGDYSILAQVQKVMPELGVAREKIVFISGIGCSSRFPYYMNTYGFHGIHGRALTLATGLKISRPELSIWVMTGDGDGLSIGGNHFLHTLRRNVDLNVVMFNNRIYGLTKGQYSPTSEQGKRTKSSPFGVVDHPINPVRAAIAAEATWVGRAVDIETNLLYDLLEKMARHKGISFLEVYQNCNIFNNKAFEHFTDKSVRADRMLYLEAGQPLIFGKDRQFAVDVRAHRPLIVDLSKGDVKEDDLLRYDPSDPTLAYMISNLDYPEYPVPVGVIVDYERDTYEGTLDEQIAASKKRSAGQSMQDLLEGTSTWTVG